MFDQSYQQLYLQKQIITLEVTYPCPRCKRGNIEAFGETETFICSVCSRNFVAINAGRTLFPAHRLKTKIAPVFWWDGLHWHLAGTTADKKQAVFVIASILMPLVILNALVFSLHGQSALVAHSLSRNFFLNLLLLNLLVSFFITQLLYLMCWEQSGQIKRPVWRNTQSRHYF
jgi:hypothetical protein